MYHQKKREREREGKKEKEKGRQLYVKLRYQRHKSGAPAFLLGGTFIPNVLLVRLKSESVGLRDGP